jgi:uncharacterized protein (DUF2252 family)
LALRVYREKMHEFAYRGYLDTWYSHTEADVFLGMVEKKHRKTASAQLARVQQRDRLAAFAKLTEVVDGQRRIIHNPPLLYRLEKHESATRLWLTALFKTYFESLEESRKRLLSRYQLVDLAHKVVGVGSVGTRCFVLLFQGPNGGPLFMQAKEAGLSSVEQAGLPVHAEHQGQRVVEGQRMLQAASDVLLGWTTDDRTGTHFYIRQLWDAKGSADLNGMTPTALATYAGACGWALARAHARTGDSVHIAGYLGGTGRFDQAVAAFAHAYADQNERDHKELVEAAGRGVVPVSPAG